MGEFSPKLGDGFVFRVLHGYATVAYATYDAITYTILRLPQPEVDDGAPKTIFSTGSEPYLPIFSSVYIYSPSFLLSLVESKAIAHITSKPLLVRVFFF